MKKRIINSDGNIILSSLDDICFQCINSRCNNGYASVNCKLDDIKKRLGISRTNYGSVFACSDNSKTTKNFRIELDILASGIKFFETTKKEIVTATIKDEQVRVNRLIHNLKSLNAHIIQELYSVIPQELFISNYSKKKTIELIQETIKDHSLDAAKAFLRIAKFNTGVKAEFSVYDKLLKNDVQLNPMYHKLRDVLMLVLHMFFADFADKHVYVEVNNYFEKAYIDFESVYVAFYHIIENSTKYVCPNTEIEVSFQIEENMHLVTFSMRSFYLYPQDVEKIFDDGYSGILAKQTELAGHGLGMFRAKQLLLKNNSTIVFNPGTIKYNYDGIDYADNRIIVKLPRFKAEDK